MHLEVDIELEVREVVYVTPISHGGNTRIAVTLRGVDLRDIVTQCGEKALLAVIGKDAAKAYFDLQENQE